MTTVPVRTESAETFEQILARANLQPLWDRYDKLLTAEPQVPDTAMHWRWAEMLPFIDRAGSEIPMDKSERRVLMLSNPAFDGKPFATTNLFAGLQILNPGERAPVHRHSPSAMRFVLEGDGAATVVDGQHCDMLPGDLILTPNWCWHEHRNDSATRCIWLDALDLPLTASMGAVFSERGQASAERKALWHIEDSAFANAGLLPDTSAPRNAYSPMFRYPWTRTVAALEQAPEMADGSRRVRYVDPTTGEPAIPTLDCYVWQLAKNRATTALRSSANAVFAVVEGEGSSEIGGRTLRWQKNDVFTVPHWTWASHRTSSTARLFYFTDREVLRRLNWLREETRAS
jgi:gentisate 1,2-dioxygenase